MGRGGDLFPHAPSGQGHRDPVIPVAGRGVQLTEVVSGGLERTSRGKDTRPQQVGAHAENAGALAGASRSDRSSSSSAVTVTEAPAISSDVMNSPT